MGAELRIADEELARQAEELAALRQMSVPDAVAEAVRDRLKRERAVQAKVEQILEWGRDIRAHLKEPISQQDIDDLYGPDGLPA